MTWVKWKLVSVHLETMLISVQNRCTVHTSYMCGLRQMHHRLRNNFGCTQWCADMMWVKWRLVLVHLEIVLVSMKDMVHGLCQTRHRLKNQFGRDATPR